MSYSQRATAKMQMTGWNETVKEDIDEGAGDTRHGVYYPKRGITTVEAGFTYTGDIEGSSTIHYLITYKEGGAPILAVERFTGSIAGRSGSCVFTSTGTQAMTTVEEHRVVVPGLGTGQLESLRGEIDLRIEGQSEDGYPLTLAYDLD